VLVYLQSLWGKRYKYQKVNTVEMGSLIIQEKTIIKEPEFDDEVKSHLDMHRQQLNNE